MRNPRGYIKEKEKKNHKLHSLFVSEFKKHMKERNIKYVRPWPGWLACGVCGFKKDRKERSQT